MFVSIRKSEESRKALENVPDEDLRKLVQDCVTAILVLGQNRQPIKKADLNRHLHSNYRINNAILNFASYELYKNCGHRLYDVDDGKRLLLVNSSTKFSSYAKRSKADCDELAVLYFILMDIFASSDEKISEDDLKNSLTPLDLSEETLKGYVDSFVKKLYLVATKDTFNQEKKFYSWGPRALAEIEPDGFMECFLSLVGTGTSRDWPEQKIRIDKLKAIPNR